MVDNVRKLNPPKGGIRKMFGDSLINFAAKMGGGMDKLSQSVFAKTRTRLDKHQLAALYRENFIAGKAIDIVPNDMTREWRSFADSGLDETKIEAIENAEKELSIQSKVNEALKWARLYGGSIIVMDIANSGEPWEPLDLETVKEGSLKGLVVFDAENASYVKINQTDPFADNFQKPESYRLSYTAVEIHHTRVLRFDGVVLPNEELRTNRYWNDSILNRAYDQLKNLGVSLDSTAGLLFESNVDIVKVPDLIQMLSTEQGTNSLLNRFGIAKTLKSNNRITLLDGNEEYQNVAKSFAGIPDVLDRFLNVISAVFDIPVTRLFGVSPGGLNATGESDLRNYYDSIAGKQQTDLDPAMQYFDQILSRSLGINPDQMGYDWNQLWQLSDSDTAIIQKSNAERDQIYLANAVLKPSQVATQLMNEDVYIGINPAYIAELEKFEDEEPDEDEDIEIDPDAEDPENPDAEDPQESPEASEEEEEEND